MRMLRNTITHILNGLAGISFLVMVILTCWQVFTRYILQDPSTWSEELASIVTSERGHMNIPIIVEKFGASGQRLLNCLGEVIAFLFSATILVFGGIQITTLAMGQMTSSLGVPIGVFYIILPLCGVLNMFYTILNIADILKGQTSEKEAA